jgi:hypothetical protein
MFHILTSGNLHAVGQIAAMAVVTRAGGETETGRHEMNLSFLSEK